MFFFLRNSPKNSSIKEIPTKVLRGGSSGTYPESSSEIRLRGFQEVPLGTPLEIHPRVLTKFPLGILSEVSVRIYPETSSDNFSAGFPLQIPVEIVIDIHPGIFPKIAQKMLKECMKELLGGLSEGTYL